MKLRRPGALAVSITARVSKWSRRLTEQSWDGVKRQTQTGDCKETLETWQRGVWSSKHEVVSGGHARLHALLPRSEYCRNLIKTISSGTAVSVRKKKRESSDVCEGAQRVWQACVHSLAVRWPQIKMTKSAPHSSLTDSLAVYHLICRKMHRKRVNMLRCTAV